MSATFPPGELTLGAAVADIAGVNLRRGNCVGLPALWLTSLLCADPVLISVDRNMGFRSFRTPNGRTPNGIRTRAATLKGWCPRPLDDGGLHYVHSSRRGSRAARI